MIRAFKDILDLFYPKACLICSKPLVKGERHVCIGCLCNLPRTNYHSDTDNPAKSLFAGFPQINDVTAYLFFERQGKTQTLTHSFKYRGNKDLAEYLGQIAAKELFSAGFFASIDTLIPVPLHKKKIKTRGYNQSEYIARGIDSVYKCGIDTRSLRRHVFTETQTKKSTYDRHVNVEKIFTLDVPEKICGKHILLIDDVITTGATTSACIKALAEVPGIKISVFALSIAKDN